MEFILADRTNGRAYATMLRDVASVVCTECIVAKRCVLEQKTWQPLGSRIWEIDWYQMNDLDLCLEVVSRSCQLSRYNRRWISRKLLQIEANWFQRATNRKWHMGYQMVAWPMTHVPPKVLWGSTVGYPSDSSASCSDSANMAENTCGCYAYGFARSKARIGCISSTSGMRVGRWSWYSLITQSSLLPSPSSNRKQICPLPLHHSVHSVDVSDAVCLQAFQLLQPVAITLTLYTQRRWQGTRKPWSRGGATVWR